MNYGDGGELIDIFLIVLSSILSLRHTEKHLTVNHMDISAVMVYIGLPSTERFLRFLQPTHQHDFCLYFDTDNRSLVFLYSEESDHPLPTAVSTLSSRAQANASNREFTRFSYVDAIEGLHRMGKEV